VPVWLMLQHILSMLEPLLKISPVSLRGALSSRDRLQTSSAFLLCESVGFCLTFHLADFSIRVPYSALFGYS
jgi:hypothetical protein